MNLFQKDLSMFQEEMMNNRASYETLKGKKEKKESDRINLSLEIYNIDSRIADIKVIKKRRLRANEKIKNLKLLRASIILSLILVGIGTLGMAFVSLLIPLVGIPVLSGLGMFLSKKYKTKLSAIFSYRNEISKNKTIKELNEILETLDKESEIKKIIQKDIETDITLLNENLDKIDLDASKIHNSYKFVLDVYQDVLNKVDASVSDEELDQFINKEHAQVMPMMVKKLYDRKNV